MNELEIYRHMKERKDYAEKKEDLLEFTWASVLFKWVKYLFSSLISSLSRCMTAERLKSQ